MGTSSTLLEEDRNSDFFSFYSEKWISSIDIQK